MTTVHLVVNPAAGAGTAGTHLNDVERTFAGQGLTVKTYVTRDPDHAVDVARGADPDDVVAPLGGDGMLGLMAKGLAHSDALLLPLPAGRGNDYVRALGWPRDTCAVARQLRKALESAEGHRRLDVGIVNDRPFLGVVSVGFDAETNALANTYDHLRGPLVYTVAGAATIARTRKRTYRITDNTGHSTTVDAWNIAVGNSGRHGGGQRVCPGADMTDGQLDLVIFGGTRAEFTLAAAAMRTGRHVRLPHVTTATLTRARIELLTEEDTDSQPIVHADGDAASPLPVSVGLSNHHIRVVALELE